MNSANVLSAMRLMSGCLLVAFAAPRVEAAGCSVSSLFDICALIGRDISADQRKALLSAYPGAEGSMLDVKEAAESLAIALLGVKATLHELTSEVRGPKIIHLNDPAHFLVMARASSEWVQLLDRGRPIVVSREEIEKRYSGHALIVEQAQEDAGGPKL